MSCGLWTRPGMSEGKCRWSSNEATPIFICCRRRPLSSFRTYRHSPVVAAHVIPIWLLKEGADERACVLEISFPCDIFSTVDGVAHGSSLLGRRMVCTTTKSTGRHSTLRPIICWYQIESWIFVKGVYTVTELLYWCQPNIGLKVLCRPVQTALFPRNSYKTLYTLIYTL